jgi:DnaJ-class molecular chaperone
MKETYYMKIRCGVCDGTGVKQVFGTWSDIPQCPACNGTGIQEVLVTREIPNKTGYPNTTGGEWY